MDPTLNSLTNDLDAARYFLTSSSLIIGVTAGLFFLFGLALGYFVWAVYKKGFLRRGEVIESLKSENAMLKRRIAEPSNRFSGYSGKKPSLTLVLPNTPGPAEAASPPQWSSGVSESGTQNVTPPPEKTETKGGGLAAAAFAAAAKIAERLSAPPAASGSQVVGAAVSSPVEAENMAEPKTPDSITSAIPKKKDTIAPSRPEAVEPPATLAPVIADVSAPSIPLAPVVPSASHTPLSQAFSLWTDGDWTTPPSKGSPLPESHAFTMWTGLPALISPPPPLPASKATTVWTAPDWITPSVSIARLPFSSGFSLWTQGDLEPLVARWFKPSQGFTLWTDVGDLSSCTTAPLPLAQGFTVWTEPAILPILVCRPPLPRSQAFSVWTELETLPVLVAASSGAESSVIAEVVPAAPHRAPVESHTATVAAAAAAVHSIAFPAPAIESSPKPGNGSHLTSPLEEGGEMFIPAHQRSAGPLVARAIAAARMVLGLNRREPDTSAEDADATFMGSPTRSRAFTIWTELPDTSRGPLPVQISLATLIGKSPTPTAEVRAEAAPAPAAVVSEPEMPTSPVTATVPPAYAETTPAKPINGVSAPPESPFNHDVKSGTVRHDFLLGMVYGKKPVHADDLTVLEGVTTKVQQSLYNQGVYTFEQISRWTHAQVDTFSQRLGIPGVIRREHWVHQARVRCHEHLAARPALASASTNGSSNGNGTHA